MKHLIDDGELDRIKQTIKALERDFEVNGSMKLYPSTPRQPSSKKKPPKTLKHHRALKMDEIRPEQVLVTPRRAAEITTNTITQHLDKHERGLRGKVEINRINKWLSISYSAR